MVFPIRNLEANLTVGFSQLSNAGGRLIIATDGVWDALSSEKAANCCRGLPAELAAKQIVKNSGNQLYPPRRRSIANLLVYHGKNFARQKKQQLDVDLPDRADSESENLDIEKLPDRGQETLIPFDIKSRSTEIQEKERPFGLGNQ